jgi:hypothetical protein
MFKVVVEKGLEYFLCVQNNKAFFEVILNEVVVFPYDDRETIAWKNIVLFFLNKRGPKYLSGVTRIYCKRSIFF